MQFLASGCESLEVKGFLLAFRFWDFGFGFWKRRTSGLRLESFLNSPEISDIPQPHLPYHVPKPAVTLASRILHSGSKAQDKGDSKSVVCRSLMWSLGPFFPNAWQASQRLHEGVAKKRQAREELRQKYDDEPSDGMSS